ncbi:hypothetical protein OG604_24090 [Streptomyces sp. NBC_01231]|nr:hypothetical protein OG604_24090 [Streptomyces sp. NBC_01231]
MEKQHSWRPALTEALAERAGTPGAAALGHSVLAAAALDCLNVARQTRAPNGPDHALLAFSDIIEL